MAGDVNAHSSIWNPHCRRRQNATILEDLIEQFGLLVNNEPGRITQPLSREVSIIDLALSSAQLGPLTLWKIPEEHPSCSDYELIVLRWEDVEYNLTNKSCGKITGWDIQGLIGDKNKLQAAQSEWTNLSQNRHIIDNFCTQQDLDGEVSWVESSVTSILNSYCKPIRVTPFSKKWWNSKVAEARKIWAREKKLWRKVTPSREKLKQAYNAFYHLVQRVKRECWQKFLMDDEEIPEGNKAKTHLEDKNRCWKALQYIKPRTNRTTPALKGPNDEIAVIMHEKEALVRAHAFPKPPIFQGNEYSPGQGSAHLLVNVETVAQALFYQSVKKAPGANMHNFCILCLIWTCDPNRITSLVKQAIRLQYHPQLWRYAKGILMKKLNKRE